MNNSIKKEDNIIQISVNAIEWISSLYNWTITILGVLFDNMGYLLGKLFKPFLYALEMIGIYYVLYMLSKYEVGLQMIEMGNIEQGTAYIDAIISVAESSNGIILAIAAGLPAFLGAMRLVKQRLVGKDVKNILEEN